MQNRTGCMTTFRLITNRLELAFWDFIIQHMSESALLRDLFQTLHDISHEKFQHSILRWGLLLSIAGLILGFLAGVIIAL